MRRRSEAPSGDDPTPAPRDEAAALFLGELARQLPGALGRVAPAARVLFVSGSTRHVVVHRRVLDAGLHLLAKPFTPPCLLAKVREASAGVGAAGIER